jgi:hypothetical protein
MASQLIRNKGLLQTLLTARGSKRLMELLAGEPAVPVIDTGVFYVARRYRNPGAAIVTPSGISSTNAEWTRQYALAGINDSTHPYPDPYAAGLAAKQAIAQGLIAQAVVVVEAGNVWTVGSDDPEKNGTATGDSVATAVADIGMSAVTALNEEWGVLARNQVFFVFKKNAGLSFICKQYAVRLVMNQDTGGTGTLPFESAVMGEGVFTQLYGQANGFGAEFIHLDNCNAAFRFEASLVKLQQSQPVVLANFTEVFFTIHTLYSADATTFRIASSALPATNAIPVLDIDITHVFWGSGQVPGVGPAIVSMKHLIYISTIFYGMKINVDIDSMDMVTTSIPTLPFRLGSSLLLYVATGAQLGYTNAPHRRIYHTQLNMRIGNFYEKMSPESTAAGLLFSIAGGALDNSSNALHTSSNNSFTISFTNTSTVSRLGFFEGPMCWGQNNYITIDLGNFYRRAGLDPTIPFIKHEDPNLFDYPEDTQVVRIKGNITLEDGSFYLYGGGLYHHFIIEATVRVKSGGAIPIEMGNIDTLVFQRATIIAPAGAPSCITGSMEREVLSAGLISNVPVESFITVKGIPPTIVPDAAAYFP